MPVRALHRGEHALDKRLGHVLVKEIAHAVHENPPRPSPPKRQLEQVGMLRKGKRARVTGIAHRLQSASEAFRVTVLAPGADLRATSDRIPGRVGPFDACRRAHRVASSR
jgi:hypothetical protein